MNADQRGRLLVYSQDGLGLGHLRRTSSIVGEFLRRQPEACALSVSDSPLGKFFSSGPRQDYLKLPSIRKAGPGDWHPISLSVPFEEVLSLRREILKSVVQRFRPDILLVDHMPHGAMGELVPALESIDGLPVRVVLGLRDILDAPSVVRERWEVEGAHKAIAKHYDDVLVYGSRDVFDVAEQYDWPAETARRLVYCGYVCAPPPLPPQSRARALRTRYLRNRRKGRLVIAMAGGGADAYPLFRALLDALPEITANEPVELVVVTGPFLPPEAVRDLTERARNVYARLRTTVEDVYSHLAAADLVVAMAGYNTTAEILQSGCSALLVPRSGPSAEQQMRAGLFAERGWVRWLSPNRLAPLPVAEAVLGALSHSARPPEPVPPPDLEGRQTTTDRLVGMLDGSPPPCDTSMLDLVRQSRAKQESMPAGAR